MLNGPHIVFAGGGDLGNLFPGIAVAKYLERRLPQAQITFAGDGRAVERHLVRGEGYNYVAMPGKPAPSGPLEAVRYVTDNVAGFWASRWMVREQQVSLVVGMGGCASSAMVRAAHARGIPFLLLEQNAVASRTTRRMAASAEAVCATFDQLRSHLPVGSPFALTGVPGRPEFEELYRQSGDSAYERLTDDAGRERRLVVIGGAGGASSLNEAAPAALGKLSLELSGWSVVHQTGDGGLRATQDRYQSLGVPALVVSYIDEMASLLAETDLVVCRAGGTMLSELTLSGTPAVLVPTPDNECDCQFANAEIIAEATGCPVIDQRLGEAALTDELTTHLRLLLADSAKRREIASVLFDLARPDAAEQIARIVDEILCGVEGRLAA